MLTPETIDHLGLDKAIDATCGHLVDAMIESRGVVPLHKDFAPVDLEKFMPLRRRMRGQMKTTSIEALCSYAEEFASSGATIFVSENMEAKAVLNLGTPELPGHCDNTAQLTMAKTAEFDALCRIDGQRLTQKQAAEFMEDWNELITCYQGSSTIPNGQATNALRKLTIEAARKVDSTVSSLSESQSAFEQVTASSTDPIPEFVYFNCAPYEGIDKRLFVMRLGVLTGEDKPGVVMRMQRRTMHEQHMALELADKIKAHLSTLPISVVRGSFTAETGLRS